MGGPQHRALCKHSCLQGPEGTESPLGCRKAGCQTGGSSRCRVKVRAGELIFDPGRFLVMACDGAQGSDRFSNPQLYICWGLGIRDKSLVRIYGGINQRRDFCTISSSWPQSSSSRKISRQGSGSENIFFLTSNSRGSGEGVHRSPEEDWFHLAMNVAISPAGKLTGFTAFLKSVTDLLAASAARSESRPRIRPALRPECEILLAGFQSHEGRP